MSEANETTVEEALREADEARKFGESTLRDSSRALIVLADEIVRLRNTAPQIIGKWRREPCVTCKGRRLLLDRLENHGGNHPACGFCNGRGFHYIPG